MTLTINVRVFKTTIMKITKNKRGNNVEQPNMYITRTSNYCSLESIEITAEYYK